MKNLQGYYVTENERECTKCGEIYKRTSKTVTLCNTCNSTRVKAQSIEKKMYRRAKSRASSNGIEFTIEVSDITLPLRCPILGILLKENKGRSGAYRDSYSLDRVDNNKGYIKGNIMVISQLANAMKCHATPDELIKFSEYMIETYKSGEA